MTQPVQMTPEEFWPKWFPEHTKKFWQDWRSVAWEFAEAYYQYRASLGEGVEGQPLRPLMECLELALSSHLPAKAAQRAILCIRAAANNREELASMLPAPAASGDGGKE